jgi:hypothetical protein
MGLVVEAEIEIKPAYIDNLQLNRILDLFNYIKYRNKDDKNIPKRMPLRQ